MAKLIIEAGDLLTEVKIDPHSGKVERNSLMVNAVEARGVLVTNVESGDTAVIPKRACVRGRFGRTRYLPENISNFLKELLEPRGDVASEVRQDVLWGLDDKDSRQCHLRF